MTFGWDVSTSIVGFATISDAGELVDSRYLDLRKVEGGLLKKADKLRAFVGMLANEYRDAGKGAGDHVVEDRLAKVSGGKGNAGSTMLLGAFNSIASWIVWHHWARFEASRVLHIHPSSVKAIMRRRGLEVMKGEDKKEKTLEWVRAHVPAFQVDLNRNDSPQPWNYDRADAYITALAATISPEKAYPAWEKEKPPRKEKSLQRKARSA